MPNKNSRKTTKLIRDVPDFKLFTEEGRAFEAR